jgi:hypothetical protein
MRKEVSIIAIGLLVTGAVVGVLSRAEEEAEMDVTKKPSILFVYYTYSQQTLLVVESIFRGRMIGPIGPRCRDSVLYC